MSRSMLARITAMLLVVILLLTGGIGVFGWRLIRGRQLNARLEALTKDAREIAYLASRNSRGSTVSSILREKAAAVYEEYGAYILVLDRRGHMMDNQTWAEASDPDFIASLSRSDIGDAFRRVLEGEEIAVRAQEGEKSTFTVGVPYSQSGRVLGAVLLQTPARTVESGLVDWMLPVLAAGVLAVAAASLLIFLYVRRVLKPLAQLKDAAGQMSSGDFTVRVTPPESSPEVYELANAFNTMADKLGDVEQNRREFVANVSHELRSPITSISGFVTGIEDGTIPQEEHPRYLKLVSDETKRLSGLISQLLALSRLEREDAALQLKTFDMCELLRRAVIRRVNDLQKKQMEVNCDFDLEPAMVEADEDRMEQVVINLVDNAIRFTPDRGCITLMTERSGDECVVRVKDNGVGILPEDRPHVFDRFFTADRAHTAGKGTGLGLAISQRILQMHGGRIRLEDTAEGACFCFSLRLSEQGLKNQAGSATIEQQPEDVEETDRA